MARPDARRPAARMGIHRLCQGAAGRVFEVFRITYLDFAGGRLRPALGGNAETGRRFRQKIVSAHALLGVLDGLAVRYLLDHDPRGDLASLGLKTTFRIIRAHADGRPIHFIVSKWDLLAGAYDLREIRAKLMEFGDFAALIRSARGGRPDRRAPLVRLIPVSAVGLGFAHLDAEGRVGKTRAGLLRPISVEIPLAALPIDVLHAARPAAFDGAAGVVDQRSALRETVAGFRHQLDRFEQRYPAALAGRQAAGELVRPSSPSPRVRRG